MGGSGHKASTCSAENLGLVPGLGRSPGGGHGNPPQYSGLENPHGQRSLAGYSPCNHKEWDMTEQLSTKSQTQLGRAVKRETRRVTAAEGRFTAWIASM